MIRCQELVEEDASVEPSVRMEVYLSLRNRTRQSCLRTAALNLRYDMKSVCSCAFGPSLPSLFPNLAKSSPRARIARSPINLRGMLGLLQRFSSPPQGKLRSGLRLPIQGHPDCPLFCQNFASASLNRCCAVGCGVGGKWICASQT